MRTILATSTATAATATLGGLASSGAKDPWFRALHKPRFQPPPAAFPIVWTGLYALIAAAAAKSIDALDGDERQQYEQAFVANLALNAGWTWIFFRAKRPALATLESAVLVASTTDLVRRTPTTRARALLAPYLGWTAFATVLAGSIARLNRR